MASRPAGKGAALRSGLLLALVLHALGCGEAARIDACLDRGGSWDYERERCDLERSHPVPPSSGLRPPASD